MDAVDDDSHGRRPALGQAAGEVAGLLDGVVARPGDEHVGGVRRLEQLVDGVGPLAEALLHPVEGLEEGDGVGDGVPTDHPAQRAEEGLRGHVDDPQPDAGGRGEGPVEAVVEEPGQPGRGLQEVEGVAGGRRVDDDDVEAGVVVELVQLLGRHVLLGAGQRGGDVAVEAIAHDALGLLGVGRVELDEVVERALGVEHDRPQLAAVRVLVAPAGAEPGHCAGLVGEAGQPERVGQPAGGVDGHDDGAAPGRRGLGGQDRGGGRLADAAGPAAHDHGALDDQPSRGPGRGSPGPPPSCRQRAELVDEAIGQRLDVVDARGGR